VHAGNLYLPDRTAYRCDWYRVFTSVPEFAK
jgi:hypothetical protein